MKYEEIENPRWRDTLDALNPPPLPPEPIYDLTTSDKTKLVKLQDQSNVERIPEII
jgi:hypothetical protein